MQTILNFTESFSSVTETERVQSIRALLEQLLKNELARREAHEP